MWLFHQQMMDLVEHALCSLIDRCGQGREAWSVFLRNLCEILIDFYPYLSAFLISLLELLSIWLCGQLKANNDTPIDTTVHFDETFLYHEWNVGLFRQVT